MNQTFEERYEKLKGLLDELEENKDNLDKSFEIYKQANDIYIDLEKELKDYKAKVEIVDGDNLSE